MLALMFTPWYVAPDMNLMAPAVLVILLRIVALRRGWRLPVARPRDG